MLMAPSRAWTQPCAWIEHGAQPLHLWDRLVVFDQLFECSAEAHGEISITLATAGNSNVASKKVALKPKGKWRRQKRASIRGYSNAYCPKRPPSGARGRTDGEPGKQRRFYAVTATLEVQGTADLKTLSRSDRVDVRCDLCPRGGGSIEFRERGMQSSVLGPKTRIAGRVDRVWFECARTNADLALRVFAGPDRASVQVALRPVLVLADLERRFVRKGDAYTFDISAPYVKLCKRFGRGARKKLMWELWGRGELMRIGGGGRSYLDLRCP